MRKKDSAFSIGSRPMLVPDADVEVSFQDLDSPDSGRDESGIMHRFPVREQVKTWGFAYGVLTEAEYRYMEDLLRQGPLFSFGFPGPEGSLLSCTAYCARGSAALHDRKAGIWKNLKFNIIEC